VVKLTYDRALRYFRENVKPDVERKYGKRDKVAVRTAWVEYIDQLRRENEITEKQAQEWDNPF
jgi:hypothetical protein